MKAIQPIMSDIEIPQLICKRCKHKWIPRSADYPKVCPNCNSPYWNRDYSRSDMVKKYDTGSKRPNANNAEKSKNSQTT